jgi:hypothetical protein
MFAGGVFLSDQPERKKKFLEAGLGDMDKNRISRGHF